MSLISELNCPVRDDYCIMTWLEKYKAINTHTSESPTVTECSIPKGTDKADSWKTETLGFKMFVRHIPWQVWVDLQTSLPTFLENPPLRLKECHITWTGVAYFKKKEEMQYIKLLLLEAISAFNRNNCNWVYCIHVPGHDPLIFSFLSFILFDLVGVLWPQLSKVLKPVHWAGRVPFPPVSLQRQVVCLLLQPVFMFSSQWRACK